MQIDTLLKRIGALPQYQGKQSALIEKVACYAAIAKFGPKMIVLQSYTKFDPGFISDCIKALMENGWLVTGTLHPTSIKHYFGNEGQALLNEYLNIVAQPDVPRPSPPPKPAPVAASAPAPKTAPSIKPVLAAKTPQIPTVDDARDMTLDALAKLIRDLRISARPYSALNTQERQLWNHYTARRKQVAAEEKRNTQKQIDAAEHAAPAMVAIVCSAAPEPLAVAEADKGDVKMTTTSLHSDTEPAPALAPDDDIQPANQAVPSDHFTRYTPEEISANVQAHMDEKARQANAPSKDIPQPPCPERSLDPYPAGGATIPVPEDPRRDSLRDFQCGSFDVNNATATGIGLSTPPEWTLPPHARLDSLYVRPQINLMDIADNLGDAIAAVRKIQIAGYGNPFAEILLGELQQDRDALLRTSNILRRMT